MYMRGADIYLRVAVGEWRWHLVAAAALWGLLQLHMARRGSPCPLVATHHPGTLVCKNEPFFLICTEEGMQVCRYVYGCVNCVIYQIASCTTFLGCWAIFAPIFSDNGNVSHHNFWL